MSADCAGVWLEREAAWLQRANHQSGLRAALIWESAPALVVSLRDARLPGFARAKDLLYADGLPVHVRQTGGTAVWQGPGVLNLTLVSSHGDDLGASSETEYRRLGGLVRGALAAFGIDAVYGEVHGAYCDGRFNLVVDRRKLAGTAQRRSPKALMSHACIQVGDDSKSMTDAIQRFYRFADGGVLCRPDRMISLRELIGRSSSISELSHMLRGELEHRARQAGMTVSTSYFN